MSDDRAEHDSLDDLLAPLPPSERPDRREALFQRTQRQLAFGRWVRRAGRAAGTAAVFAAGIGVGRWRAPREHETVFVPTPVPQVEPVTVPVPIVIPVPGPQVEQPAEPPAVARTAHALELDAEQADDAATAARLYRQAGDAYLTAEQDYVNASRCYRLFLARAGTPALAPDPGDSWLLTSFKNAAFKEKIRATPGNG
jgi:hypothetical protein